MDADRIDKLTGRELDAAVAEAMGCSWKWIWGVDGTNWQENIAHAIPLLLEMMAHRPGEMNLVQFCNGDGDSYDIETLRGNICMSVETEKEIPTMIARAWLKWKGAADGR